MHVSIASFTLPVVLAGREVPELLISLAAVELFCLEITKLFLLQGVRYTGGELIFFRQGKASGFCL